MTNQENLFKLILIKMKMIFIQFLKDIRIRYLALSLMKTFYSFGEILINLMTLVQFKIKKN